MNKNGAMGRWGRLIGGAMVAAVLAACGGSDDPANPLVVNTTAGQVRGGETATMRSFQGIPYAAPPVGDLRWRAPAAAANWSGVREATRPGGHCPQAATPFGDASTTEDCLYLNVHTPKTPGPHPVMVWIHGGAFYLGMSHGYNPQRLVAENTVVVTLNYRLGALGFMSHPALSAEQGGKSGNYGLMDQQAALRWVRDNIAAFGGDKDNVTLFGESAGGFSVHAHMAAPESAGLFHKTIIQSGAYALDGQDTLPAAEAKGVTVAKTAAALIGQATQTTVAECTTVACLRALPSSALLGAQMVAWPAGPIPSVDGTVLPQSVSARMLAGAQARVPMIQGTTADEWRLFVGLDEISPASAAKPYAGRVLTQADYETAIAGTFPYLAAAPFPSGFVTTLATQAYSPALFNNNPSIALGALGTDLLFACNSRRSAKVHKATTQPVYLYEFADRTAPAVLPGVSFDQGAAHTTELQYLFDMRSLSTAQQAVANTMVKSWTRFARTGNPNEAGSTAWPALGTDDRVLSFNATGTSLLTDAAFATAHRCAMWTPGL